MVALRQNDGYALAEMNSRLIPHSEETSYEDPMTDGELLAGPGSFSLKLTLISGAGSYEMETLHYRFRYQEGCFRLVVYDRMKTNRCGSPNLRSAFKSKVWQIRSDMVFPRMILIQCCAC